MLTNCLAECALLTITVSQIERDICWQSSFFSYPFTFDAPVTGGVPVGIAPPRLVWKNENGLPTRQWKFFEDMFIRFDVIHERDGRTDGHRVTAYSFNVWKWKSTLRLLSRAVQQQYGKTLIFFTARRIANTVLAVVEMSVRLSVTVWHCAKTEKRIVKQSRSHCNLVTSSS